MSVRIVTEKLSCVSAVLIVDVKPSSSVDSARTLIVNTPASPSKVNAAKFQPTISTNWLPTVAVNEFLPSEII